MPIIVYSNILCVRERLKPTIPSLEVSHTSSLNTTKARAFQCGNKPSHRPQLAVGSKGFLVLVACWKNIIKLRVCADSASNPFSIHSKSMWWTTCSICKTEQIPKSPETKQMRKTHQSVGSFPRCIEEIVSTCPREHFVFRVQRDGGRSGWFSEVLLLLWWHIQVIKINYTSLCWIITLNSSWTNFELFYPKFMFRYITDPYMWARGYI